MRWPRVFRRAKRISENSEEIRFYLEAEAEENLARGMSQEQAWSAARKKLGNPALIREELYRMTSLIFLETTLQDLRYAFRMMRKNLVFTLTVLLILTVGIGGNTAVFSVVRAVLLRPLQYRDPDRLVLVTSDDIRNPRDNTFTQRQFDEMKGAIRSFSRFGVYLDVPENMTLSGIGEPQAIRAARVSASFLEILGVQPVAGRSFLPEEEKPGGPSVAMVSSAFWKRRFGGDLHIVGKVVNLNSTAYTIIGVLPQGFTFPFADMDVWVTKPAEWSAQPPRLWYIVSWLIGFGRLRQGETLERASAELNVVDRQYIMAHPDRNEARKMRLLWMKDRLVTNIRPTLWILFGVVGFLLLIACANVAGLLMARANSRSREFAVRTALGAPRVRLIRQLLAESLSLSVLGGISGVLLAKWALSAVTHISALNLPGIGEIRLDGTALGFTLAVSVVTGLSFGLFPSMQISRPDPSNKLRESGATARHGRSGRPHVLAVSIRGLLVVAQVTLSMILLIGAALLMKSFARLQSVDPGFQPNHLLTTKIALPPARYNDGSKRVAFSSELVRRVNAIPGVGSAAMAMSLPTTSWLRTNVQIQGQLSEADPGKWATVQIQSVTPGYFRTLEIPIERGRDFASSDNTFGAPPAVIVNESFARRFWPLYPRGLSPIGQHLREGADKTDWVEIVGIVGDVHEGGLAMNALPEFYVPCVIHPPQTAYLVVRTQADPLHFVSAVRKQVQAIDRDEPLSDVQTMEDVLESSLGQRRLTMLLISSFAGVAMLLAVVGVYGAIAYSVAQRTQEIGIRRALGAQQSDIIQNVLGHAVGLAAAGVAIGLFGALIMTRVMRNLLFNVTVTDPATFAVTALLFMIAALAAGFIPARRAARIDPMAALRVG